MPENKLVLARQASAKSFIGNYVVIGIVALACFGVASRLSSPASLIVGLLGLAILGAGIGAIQLVRVSRQYRIFEDHIEIESGIVSKSIENVKLFRIRDIGLNQGVLGRMLGFGDVTLTSTDTSAPHITVRNIDMPREVYDKISEIVAQNASQKRTMILEDMPIAEGEARQ